MEFSSGKGVVRGRRLQQLEFTLRRAIAKQAVGWDFAVHVGVEVEVEVEVGDFTVGGLKRGGKIQPCTKWGLFFWIRDVFCATAP